MVSRPLSVPVFAIYGALLGLLNPRRGRPISPELLEALAPHVSDLDHRRVRLVSPALIPTGHLGVTIGHRIYLEVAPDVSDPASMALLLHELAHVRQVERMGLLGFAHSYGVQWAHGLSYRDHPLEVEARRVAARLDQPPPRHQ